MYPAKITASSQKGVFSQKNRRQVRATTASNPPIKRTDAAKAAMLASLPEAASHAASER